MSKEENNKPIVGLINQLKEKGKPCLPEEESKYFKTHLEDIFTDYFSRFYNSEETGARFKFPDDYINFQRQYKSNSIFIKDGYWYVYNWIDTITQTLYFTKGEDIPYLASPSHLWVCVGARGDKRYFFMCCDSTSKHFGSVGLFHDDHPWHDVGAVWKKGNIDYEDYIEAQTYLDFIQLAISGYGNE